MKDIINEVKNLTHSELLIVILFATIIVGYIVGWFIEIKKELKENERN